MGRKKNLQVLHKRRIHLQKVVDQMADTDTAKDDFEDELDAIQWALTKLEAEEIGIGDRVTLYVYPDEKSHQPEQGRVIGYAGDGYLVRPFTGPYSGPSGALYYPREQVKLVDP